jgi:hypothetical protein
VIWRRVVWCMIPVLLIASAVRTSNLTPTYSISNESTIVTDVLKFIISFVFWFPLRIWDPWSCLALRTVYLHLRFFTDK